MYLFFKIHYVKNFIVHYIQYTLSFMDILVHNSVLLASTCIRTYDSLYHQYKECRYNEPAKYSLGFDEEGEINHFHKDVLLKLEQRPVNLLNGIYAYFINESLYIIIGATVLLDDSLEKIQRIIIKYINNSSSITPNIILCAFSKYYDILYECYHRISKMNYRIAIDFIVIGKIAKPYTVNSRVYKNIILEEEKGRNNDKNTIILPHNNDKTLCGSTNMAYILTYVKRLVV